jgi:hypothetical protein
MIGRRPRWRTLIGIVTVLTLVSCSVQADNPDVPEPAPDHPPEEHFPIVDWSDPTKVATWEDGWSVRACEGDAPMLCVERGGNHVGVVEALGYPIVSHDSLDPAADSDTNLMALAESFFDDLRSDRLEGCGSDYGFEPIEAEPIVLANTPGLAYGFEGFMGSGAPSELIFQYATIVGDQVVLVVAAAYEENGCPGRDELSGFHSEELRAFRPYLEMVLHESSLPDIDA